MFKHEDDRRSLIELTNGEYKACKVVVAKRDCVLGDHYHQGKDERFLLVMGHATEVVLGDEVLRGVESPAEWRVPRGTYHRFTLTAGSVLVGVMSEAFNHADDFVGHPGASSVGVAGVG